MKIRDITPSEFRCIAAACPAVYVQDDNKTVLVIGKIADLEALGISSDKVGDDEFAVVVDKEMFLGAAKNI